MYYSPCSELMITVQLYVDSKPVTDPVSTKYKPFANERRYDIIKSIPTLDSD